MEIFQLITVVIALWGAIAGSLGLYLRYIESKEKKPSLIAWVLSASYVFQREKGKKNPNMLLEADLLLHNKGGKDTSISNAFAEVRVGRHVSARHSAEGEITFKEADGKTGSAPIFMPTGDSKNLHLVFSIPAVEPLTVQRSVPTFDNDVRLQLPTKVTFTMRHTQGLLKGEWAVYGKHEKFHQRLTQWMCQLDVRDGKPHWIQK